jgi:hypothetical protein
MLFLRERGGTLCEPSSRVAKAAHRPGAAITGKEIEMRISWYAVVVCFGFASESRPAWRAFCQLACRFVCLRQRADDSEVFRSSTEDRRAAVWSVRGTAGGVDTIVVSANDPLGGVPNAEIVVSVTAPSNAFNGGGYTLVLGNLAGMLLTYTEPLAIGMP